MNEPQKNEEYDSRSEEMQEVLGKVPHWMIQWGNTIFFILLLLLLLLSWMIKYPDIITTDTIVTTRIPPQKEFARLTGKLDSIFVKDLQKVKKNQVLAVIENAANTNDVYYLKTIVDTFDIKKHSVFFPIEQLPFLLLGDVESAYAAFEDSYADYKLNATLNPYLVEVRANQISMSELNARLANMKEQQSINQMEYGFKKKDLDRNKVLLDKGVISQLDYENKQLELLNSERELKSLGVSISQAKEAIANGTKDAKGVEIAQLTSESRLIRKTYQDFNNLKNAIKDWERLYVLKSDIEGQVSFFDYWSSNQTVNSGDLVFTIVPKIQTNYIAKLTALARNSGKIKVNQNVNIKLENYPETEFGMLKGTISRISLSPDDEGNYIIYVNLPDKLITTYNLEIPFKQEMQGTAEIITEDLRLIERFFNKLRVFVDN